MNKLVDERERQLIAHELGKNFLVEAGAGSGKTYSLVQRMVNLVKTGTVDVREVVAITFTKKAAEELKERFQMELERQRNQTEDETIKHRVERALADIDQCFLGTVHAFCAKLLRERPVEAGLDFDFKELDESEDRALTDEVWDRYIRDMQVKKPEQLQELTDLGLDVAGLRTTLHELREYADVNWQYSSKQAKPSTLNTAFAELKQFVESAKRSLPKEEPEKGYDGLQKKLMKTLMQLKYYDIEKDKVQVMMLRPYQKKSAVTLNRWDDKDEAKEIRDQRQLLLVEVVAPALEQWYEYCHSRILPFLKPALDYYYQVKKQRSLLNFQDLLTETATLLKHNSEVRRYFQEKYRCLLVDEFQDTDPIQAEIMLYVTGLETENDNWTDLTPRPGSLFVVGDPKQSIYRFRRADIDTYQRVKAMIADSDGEVLNLTMNFRTSNVVTEQLNDVFKSHLPTEETPYQAAYRPLNAVRHDKEGTDPLTGIYALTVPNAKKAADVMTVDADAIARHIRSTLDQKQARPRDFMLLTRYNNGLDVYAAKLEEYGIPVTTTSEVSLAEDEEIQALLQLLKALAEPTNALYVAAVLRGPLFGISDRLLYDLMSRGGNFTLFTSIPRELEATDQQLLGQTFEKLRRYYQWRKKDLPTAVIDKIIADSGYLSLYMTNVKSRRDLARFYQVQEKLRAYEGNGNSEFYQIVDRFDELVQDETLAEMVLPEEENAVRLMNVHKSKGLEAPIVFLAHPKKFVEQADKISKHIKREEQRSDGYFSFSNEKGERLAQPLHWETHRQEEYDYLKAEEMRLIYVAATRAEKMLVISQMDKGNEKNNPWLPLLAKLELQELEIANEVKKPLQTDVGMVDRAQFNALRQNLTNWLQPLSEPSFHMYSPSEMKEAKRPTVIREQGGGPAWGNAVHAAFERAVKGEEWTDDQLLLVLEQHEVEMERLPEIKEAIMTLQRSPIGKRVQRAHSVFAEIPFTVSLVKGDDLYPDDARGEVLLNGTIDLIFKEADGWVLVDYKTDRIKESSVAELQNYYAQQLLTYKAAWEKMTGEKVKEVNLYFVTLQQLVTI